MTNVSRSPTLWMERGLNVNVMGRIYESFGFSNMGVYVHAHAPNLVGHFGVYCERWNKSLLSGNM